MKIAILSDIHSNVFALKSVLRAVVEKEVEVLMIAGDFVGYYFWPAEVFDLLEDLNPNSFTYGQMIGPSNYEGDITILFFGHET